MYLHIYDYVFERVRGGEGQRESERETQADSRLSAEPDFGGGGCTHGSEIMT